jgi:hypothetical protein
LSGGLQGHSGLASDPGPSRRPLAGELVFARNAFDEQYFDQFQVPSGNTGLIVGNPGDPRTYGLTVAAEF